MSETAAGTVTCENCGGTHEAWYDHEGQFGEGAIYAVECPADRFTDFYTADALRTGV